MLDQRNELVSALHRAESIEPPLQKKLQLPEACDTRWLPHQAKAGPKQRFARKPIQRTCDVEG